MKKKIIILLISIIKIIFVYNADPMNYIIDNIYLGDKYAARDEEYLKKNNISTVVNCAKGLTSNYKDLKFMELNLYDKSYQKLFPKIDIAYRFIKQNPNGNVLIHCKFGRSRSSILVIYYLMKEYGWDYDKCYKYIKQRRPIIHPNSGFVAQIKEYYNKNLKK